MYLEDIHEWWVGKELEGGGRDLFEGTIPVPGESEENH
jgi:hypothetical protein